MRSLLSLFLAVCQIEGNVKGKHADGVSYGPAGVTAGCLKDFNDACGFADDRMTMEDMDNQEKAVKVFVWYTSHYGAKTDADRARVWHGGPSAIKHADGPMMADYVARVLAAAEGVPHK